jgi:TP901 family phage tail tape measure protein
VDHIDLPIKARFDAGDFDKAIAKLKELEAKGFTIPINFKSNLESLKADAEAMVTRLKGQWQGLASDFSSGNAKLLSELDRLGESKAAGRLRAGFASVREEVLVLDNLISQLGLKGDAGAGLAKGLAAGRIADLVKSGRAHGETVSFAGYGEQAERATTAQEKFVAAEVKGVQAAAQSEAALAAESAVLKAKGVQFEEARAAAQRFQRAEAEQTAQTQRAGQATGADVALQRQRSAALIRNAESDVALQRQRSAAYLAEIKRAEAEQTAEIRKQQSARDALQRQRSQALIRQAREEERLATTGGLRGVLGTVGTAATFIGVYGGIDLAVRSLRAGAESSVEFERKLATLSVIFRGTKEEARALATETVQLAASFGQDGIAALEVAKDFARFGGTAADVLEAVRATALAANVAEIPIEEASKHLQAIMAGYTLQTGQLVAIVGQLNTVSNTWPVTVKQLLEGLSRVAPLAKEAGVSLSEVIGYQAVISGRTGRPGAEAGQAIKSLISRLSKPEIQGALEEVGVNVTDQKGELKSASTIINELYLAYQRLGAAEKEELLIKVAGTFQAARIAALLDGYVSSQLLAIRASRDLASADRENLAVRETLSSQLGTLKTQWEGFWAGAGGAGKAAGAQSQITEVVKSLSNLLAVVNQLQAAGSKGAGGINTRGIQDAIVRFLPGAFPGAAQIIPAAQNTNTQAEGLLRLLKLIGGESVDATAELEKFNSEVEKLQNLGQADEAAKRLFKTIADAAAASSPEKLTEMFRAAAEAAAPGNLPQQNTVFGDLTQLAKAGDMVGVIAYLSRLGADAEGERAKHLGAASRILAEEIVKQTSLLDLERKQRDAAAGKNDKATVDEKDRRILELENLLTALKARQSGTSRRQFEEGEEPYRLNLGDQVVKEQEVSFRRLTASADAYGQVIKALPSLSRADELAGEMQILDYRSRQLDVVKQQQLELRKSNQIGADQKKTLQENLEKQIDQVNAAKDKVREEMRYQEVIEGAKRGAREGKAIAGLYGVGENETEKLKARIEGLTGSDLAKQRALDDVRRQEERDRQSRRPTGDTRRGIWGDATQEFADRERRLREEEALRQRIETELHTKKSAQGIDPLTGLPTTLAGAKAQFESATDPVEKARSLARLKEMAISLEDAENDLIRRRFQLESEITNERRKQAQEASKNLLMADRETQLRAALAATFAQSRGGRPFTAEELQFFDQKTKSAIQQTNPDLLPPEFQTRLRELQEESTALTNAFRPLKEASDAAAAAIAKLQLPAPAINPAGQAPSAGAGIDISPTTASIENAGGAVRAAVDVLGTAMVRQLDSISAALDMVSANLGTRVARLESGDLTSRIGRAQGAASVLA